VAARIVLILTVVLVAYGLVCGSKSIFSGNNVRTDGPDIKLYKGIVERIHNGDSYYYAAGDELRSRGYPTRPFLTWRMPFLAWVLGFMPSPLLGKWTLIALALAALYLWVKILQKEGGAWFAISGALLFYAPLLFCFSDNGFYVHELWAGVCIALSLATYTGGRKLLSVASGIAALMIRELALPYVLIMLFAAIKTRQRGETAFWSLGLFAFGVFLVFHCFVVSDLIRDTDLASRGWLQFGGWRFVMNATRANAFLVSAPWWIPAILLPLILLGLLGWRTKGGTLVALTTLTYMAAYLIVGRFDNILWGLLYAPLLPLGLVHAPRSLTDLVKAAIVTKKKSSFNRGYGLP
jgi:hypothetical protein